MRQVIRLLGGYNQEQGPYSPTLVLEGDTRSTISGRIETPDTPAK